MQTTAMPTNTFFSFPSKHTYLSGHSSSDLISSPVPPRAAAQGIMQVKVSGFNDALTLRENFCCLLFFFFLKGHVTLFLSNPIRFLGRNFK